MTKTKTMPATLSLHMLTPSPLPSKPLHHVSELAWTLLMLTLPALDQVDVDIGQATHAQTRPAARQDAHDGISGRARASSCPIASRLPSLSPCARRLTTVPSTSQTSPIGRRPAVDDALVKNLPPPYCHAVKKMTTRLSLLWPRHHSRQPRLDVANTPRPCLASSSPWNDELVVDPPRHLAAPPRPINRGALRSN